MKKAETLNAKDDIHKRVESRNIGTRPQLTCCYVARGNCVLRGGVEAASFILPYTDIS